MFLNWLNPKKVEAQGKTTSKHFVLNSLINKPANKDEEEIFFGCGCFWGAEKGFWKLPGVITTAVGYAGGAKKNPTYREVCSGRTNHAEVVRVIWNKLEIDLSDLLKMFWECHDPTQGNRQGNDSGSQYRSAIYLTKQDHKTLAINSLEKYQVLLQEKGFGSITTQIETNIDFYYAEDYHQQYLAKPGSRPYCSAMPTNVSLKDFKGSNYKLNSRVWDNFNWEQNHCVLRSSNSPIIN
ncbi:MULTISPECIES: peptide-methionine (S)-S-oxide reductase MsrA [Prochlorococcus]|uniref:Peptide methionine sulfoxide reductase MsrA n=1 Tax=Prochlorococcus marinus (strain SARG / CCMP1375 / SS120) TaxID=167539 RepID=Q7VCK0_PROMA|nr:MULTISPECIES: peptide-methionine (S)-S-oxide reductase MsrA [Prochlorococcus]AAP99784.1 Peptide methionine sulfoxide reductase [Prochlorococcus marinus subsp. marinus str. CCMP1375]KGG11872.1 Peptide methionine sulfoxide reductase MsrA [Prochlorococcus marinus str. LG]KGG21821.1 Peptide methionine sulfoxide reductase MsrA [Prochlorococcus marinus str. SS2]KGG23748.1 Peptide methionine sulfoxide reductase MsrA [Prochlorococcus marinus str. SS35]KGG32016.1 Peptide methionine sulfoxide reducta